MQNNHQDGNTEFSVSAFELISNVAELMIQGSELKQIMFYSHLVM